MTDVPLLRAALDALDLGVAIVGPDCRIRFCNVAYADLVDAPVEFLVGSSLFGAGSPCETFVEREVEWAEAETFTLSGESPDGVAVDVVVRPLEAGSDIRLVLVRRGLVRARAPRWLPVEVVADVQEFLRDLSGHPADDQAVWRAPLSILVVAVEGLDRVRRARGEEAEEEVLRQVAQVLVLDKRKSDAVSRYGDRRFLVLAPDTAGSKAALLAERFRRGVEALEIRIDGSTDWVRLLISVAEYRPHLDGPIRDAVEQASAALPMALSSSPGATAPSASRNDVDTTRIDG